MELVDILTIAIKKQASDVHLKAGIVPVIRKHGRLRPLQAGLNPIAATELEGMALGIMDSEQQKFFHDNKELDFSHGISGVGRFRINVFRQRGSIRMVIRNIPFEVPSIDSLALPSVVKKIADFERGLVLVTGVTGSGKSSTLAAMIDHINNSHNNHILTIEDPIEFLIRDRKSIISQREIGIDTRSFSGALRSALRQDPDVILIGEMRDKETIEIALTAAETGHLVLSTLHTVDAQESINRVLSVFEPHQHLQIRTQLASVLGAVVSQRLATRKDGKGFVPAVEVLINNQRTKDMIEDPARTSELRIAIEQSRDTMGMQSFDQSLMDLMASDLVSYEEALRLSSNPEDFALRYSGVSSGKDQWSTNKYKDNLQAQWHSNDGTKLEIDKKDYDDENS